MINNLVLNIGVDSAFIKLINYDLVESKNLVRVRMPDERAFYIINEIVDNACNIMQIKKEILLSKTRRRTPINYVNIRYGIYKYIIDNYNKSFEFITIKQISNFFNRDHSSIIHGLKEYENIITVKAMTEEKKEMLFLLHNLIEF